MVTPKEGGESYIVRLAHQDAKTQRQRTYIKNPRWTWRTARRSDQRHPMASRRLSIRSSPRLCVSAVNDLGWMSWRIYWNPKNQPRRHKGHREQRLCEFMSDAGLDRVSMIASGFDGRLSLIFLSSSCLLRVSVSLW